MLADQGTAPRRRSAFEGVSALHAGRLGSRNQSTFGEVLMDGVGGASRHLGGDPIDAKLGQLAALASVGQM